MRRRKRRLQRIRRKRERTAAAMLEAAAADFRNAISLGTLDPRKAHSLIRWVAGDRLGLEQANRPEPAGITLTLTDKMRAEELMAEAEKPWPGLRGLDPDDECNQPRRQETPGEGQP